MASNIIKKSVTVIGGIAATVIVVYLVISTNAISFNNLQIDDSAKELTAQIQQKIDSAKKLVTEISPTLQKSSKESGKKITDVINSIPTQLAKPSSSNELIQYALKKINEDREKAGLSPVLLSNNEAAQAHAEDVLKTGTISHWMTNGEKPYMTYTRYGG